MDHTLHQVAELTGDKGNFWVLGRGEIRESGLQHLSKKSMWGFSERKAVMGSTLGWRQVRRLDLNLTIKPENLVRSWCTLSLVIYPWLPTEANPNPVWSKASSG